ncbi:energy-coupling factor ABC transporter ATP-binding protein [Trichloromonas sp.]|uniref:energy-coupling factor ABC transporter ATP-binding protein n=1 Tax=Trichloromonas sp. TaxID=3069249 RepID=UPI003D813A45
MPPVLEVRDVEFSYPDGTRALQSLSLGFARGRRTALLGRNGAGKSTLFALLNGIERPGRGEVHFDGAPVAYDRGSLRQLRRSVGVVFQDPDTQLFSASIREDISFGPVNLGLPRGEIQQRVEAALAAVGLTALAERPTHALSYGEKKRACIAGVLAMDPRVLILDEPTAGLDPPMAAELMILLNALHERGITVILATHDVDFAFAWADDLCVLQEGTLAFHAAADDFSAVAEHFPGLGLELPWVYEVFGELWRKGAIDGETPPRTRAELLARLR